MQYWRHQGHSSNVSFPLEGKCRGAAKGCTTLQDGLTRYGYVTAKRRLPPANRYLLLFDSKAARTEILRFAQNDCTGSMSMLYHNVMPNRKLLAKGFLLR